MKPSLDSPHRDYSVISGSQGRDHLIYNKLLKTSTHTTLKVLCEQKITWSAWPMNEVVFSERVVFSCCLPLK